ncbi:MAG: hypothetical protein KGL46_04765 [Hyphomicrobiales bacterium]|nr:hypothetical protein [Hyphomicrobiales bacterium]
MPNANQGRCADCAYWELVRPNEGWCRRHSPTTPDAADAVAHWPQSHAEQWCGDFVASHRTSAPAITCESCRFWRQPEAGLQPVDRGDRIASWWSNAGLCHRDAPKPNAAPGQRAYWAATHRKDRCGFAEARTDTGVEN